MKFVNHHQGCCGFVPTRSDGSEWAHVLTVGAGTVVHADTARECLEELVPGYAACGDDAARLAARVRHAEATATTVQRARIERARSRGALDPAQDAELVDLLLAPKSSALLLATPDRPGEQAPWAGPAAIVAVTTTYAPVGATAPLQGDIVWLDPRDEEGYLHSLAAAGANDYWTSGE